MVNILHLYPKLMNLYGDYGNIAGLKKHLEDQGLEVCVDNKNIGDSINFDKYDFIYMGSGSERNQKVTLNDFIKYKTEFVDCVKNGKLILFTGNSIELLGEKIDDVEALGIFDFETKHYDKRFTGDVIVRNDEFGYLVGFINKSSVISGGSSYRLFDYVCKESQLDKNMFEGFRFNNLFATHLIGPVLIKNPSFMNKIVSCLMPVGMKMKKIVYQNEEESYIITLNSLKERFK